MTALAAKKGSARSGATALELLSSPLNAQLLRRLEKGPVSLIELRRDAGFPPQSTTRTYLRTLEEVEAIERARAPQSKEPTLYSLTASGHALMAVATTLQRWLAASPQGPIELETPAAKSAIKALVDGWSSSIVRELAAQTLALTELAKSIPKISYPALDHRLTAMRLVELIEPQKKNGRSTPYRPTDWLRCAVAPLSAASEWEREHLPEATPPIGSPDVEAAFLLAVPLMQLPSTLTGTVRLAVEIQRGGSPVFAGVLVCVEKGAITSCTPDLDGEAEAWVSGAPRSWLRHMNLGEENHLELGGDSKIARAVLTGLERTA